MKTNWEFFYNSNRLFTVHLPFEKADLQECASESRILAFLSEIVICVIMQEFRCLVWREGERQGLRWDGTAHCTLEQLYSEQVLGWNGSVVNTEQSV